jgi:hypothetical protein
VSQETPRGARAAPGPSFTRTGEPRERSASPPRSRTAAESRARRARFRARARSSARTPSRPSGLSTLHRYAGRRIKQDGAILTGITRFAVTGPTGALGIRAKAQLGQVSAWLTVVLFGVGPLVANVGLFRSDSRDLLTDARRGLQWRSTGGSGTSTRAGSPDGQAHARRPRATAGRAQPGTNGDSIDRLRHPAPSRVRVLSAQPGRLCRVRTQLRIRQRGSDAASCRQGRRGIEAEHRSRYGVRRPAPVSLRGLAGGRRAHRRCAPPLTASLFLRDEPQIRPADCGSRSRTTKAKPPRERLFVSTRRRQRHDPRRRSDRDPVTSSGTRVTTRRTPSAP